ncbi:CIC11C00000000995 [Sungouiella intermedia]|uniref:CIC11C00000000321 n=1 Tax=Sungouiella intermedia TaxID=45354 RepID=A0A1L0BLX4_9ASCO|nr:CIC11C00000000321 [[Candida] intermedia]SGZ52369.1 CIC11C00000000995 [[Candida] intermedia]
MFEDTIPHDENVMTTALGNSEDIFNLRPVVASTLEQTLSKDSDVFRYNYGRLNGMVPERSAYFSLVYPKKATNLDTDFHHLSFDVDILTRWISRDVLKFLVPILHFQDMQLERMEKRAAALTAKPVPTTQELQLCSKLKGAGYWSRKGNWFCTTKNVSKLHDEFGPKCFNSYSEWAAWEQKITSGINDARNADDRDMLQKLRQARYVRWNE